MTRRHASYSTGTKKSFVLTIEHFRTLIDAMKKFAEKVECQAECQDKLVRTFDLAALKEFPNTPDKQIITMTIRCRDPEDFNRSATFTLRTQGWFGLFTPINLSIEGPESELEKLKSSFHEIIVRIAPWYDRATRFDFVSLFMNIMFFGWTTLVAIVAVYLYFQGRLSEMNTDLSKVSVMPFLVMTVVVIFGVMLNRVRSRLFPLGAFAINDGLKRQQTMDNWRWTAIIGGVVGVASSLVASVVWALLSRS